MTVSQEVQIMESKHPRDHAGTAAVTAAHLADPKFESASFGHYQYTSKSCILRMPFACSLIVAGQCLGSFNNSVTST